MAKKGKKQKYFKEVVGFLFQNFALLENKTVKENLDVYKRQVESVLGAPIEEEDIPKLIGFLKKQEANGKFFSKAMQKETNTDMEEV